MNNLMLRLEGAKGDLDKKLKELFEDPPDVTTDVDPGVLRAWQKKTGHSQAWFTRQSGVALSTVRRALAGRGVSYRVANAISSATDGQVSVLDLMKAGKR